MTFIWVLNNSGIFNDALPDVFTSGEEPAAGPLLNFYDDWESTRVSTANRMVVGTADKESGGSVGRLIWITPKCGLKASISAHLNAPQFYKIGRCLRTILESFGHLLKNVCGFLK